VSDLTPEQEALAERRDALLSAAFSEATAPRDMDRWRAAAAAGGGPGRGWLAAGGGWGRQALAAGGGLALSGAVAAALITGLHRSPVPGPSPGASGGASASDQFVSTGCHATTVLPFDPVRAASRIPHQFIGNAAISPSSTTAQLQAAPGCSQRGADTTVAWLPVLHLSGTEVEPGQVDVFYDRPAGATGDVAAIPSGAMVEVGSESATTAAENSAMGSSIYWSCGGATGRSPVPISCGGDAAVVHADLSACARGATVTGMSCSDGGTPRVRAVLRAYYPAIGASGPEGKPAPVTIAAGGGADLPVSAMHAGIWYSWRVGDDSTPNSLTWLIDVCINHRVNAPPGFDCRRT
jgi:hypothetical protein